MCAVWLIFLFLYGFLTLYHSPLVRYTEMLPDDINNINISEILFTVYGYDYCIRTSPNINNCVRYNKFSKYIYVYLYYIIFNICFLSYELLLITIKNYSF